MICAVHTQPEALGTCARCGTFFCASCHAGAWCGPCLAAQPARMAKEQLRGAFIEFAGVTAVYAAAIFAFDWVPGLHDAQVNPTFWKVFGVVALGPYVFIAGLSVVTRWPAFIYAALAWTGLMLFGRCSGEVDGLGTVLTMGYVAYSISRLVRLRALKNRLASRI
jgi:hypothetical protein